VQVIYPALSDSVPICRFAAQVLIPRTAAETAGSRVLTGQGNFPCHRGESPGSGDDAGAQLLCAFGPAVQSIFPLHSVPCPCPRRCDIRCRVLKRSHEPLGLLLAGRQQIS
jgi:hypothetical protein